MKIDGSREFTESEIQAWGLYLGQVGHKYKVEAVKWLLAAGNLSNVNMRQIPRTKTRKIETNQEGNYACKTEIKVRRERLRSHKVNIMLKSVPNLKTGQLGEDQGAEGIRGTFGHCVNLFERSSFCFAVV